MAKFEFALFIYLLYDFPYDVREDGSQITSQSLL